MSGASRFAVGDFECLAISDGAPVSEPPEVPGPILFANAPPAEVDAAVVEAGGSTPWTTWTEQITCLLIDAGAQRILIDTGAGALDPATGRLTQNLADAGVTPPDIDVVILTHGHPDHLGGLVDPNGSLVFPRAVSRVLVEAGRPAAQSRYGLGDGVAAVASESGSTSRVASSEPARAWLANWTARAR